MDDYDSEELDIEVLLGRIMDKVTEMDYRLSQLESEVRKDLFEPLTLH